MKICDCCKTEFEIQIKGSGGTNRRFCYDCLPDGLERKERNTLRSQLLKRMSHEHKKSLGCSRCVYNNFGGALEWHHTEDDKAYEPSEALAVSWDKYIIESSKCVLLCANCHREIHAGM